jgi:hypothetical protein
MDQLDRELAAIENDPHMDEAEKQKAIREAEMAAGDWERERQAAHQEVDRQFGY